MRPGDHVEVRNNFDNSWSRGFEVVAVLESSEIQIRRRSDGADLPVMFPALDVREERRRKMWWV